MDAWKTSRMVHTWSYKHDLNDSPSKRLEFKLKKFSALVEKASERATPQHVQLYIEFGITNRATGKTQKPFKLFTKNNRKRKHTIETLSLLLFILVIFGEFFRNVFFRSLSILYLTWWIFIRIFPSLSLFASLSFNFHPLNALEFENDCGSKCETCALNSPLRMSNGTSSTPQTPISGKLNNQTRTKKNIERRKVLSFISFFSGFLFVYLLYSFE